MAFSGTEDKRDLILSLYIEISRGKRYLSASMEDRLSWYEWVLIADDEYSNFFIRPFIVEDSLEEEIREYYLQ